MLTFDTIASILGSQAERHTTTETDHNETDKHREAMRPPTFTGTL